MCLCFILLLSLGAPAWADNQSRTVIGADLSQEQVESVYQSFGLRRGDVPELTMTNAEERQYLQGLVNESVIGTRSISCIYMELLPAGSGLSVSTNNVTLWTEDMYIGVLATTGITDARIIVSAPFEVSGTSALCGIYKAYEDMTGMSPFALASQSDTEEVSVTENLAQQISSMDSGSLVGDLKLMLNETKNMTDEEIRDILAGHGVVMDAEAWIRIEAKGLLEGYEVCPTPFGDAMGYDDPAMNSGTRYSDAMSRMVFCSKNGRRIVRVPAKQRLVLGNGLLLVAKQLLHSGVNLLRVVLQLALGHLDNRLALVGRIAAGRLAGARAGCQHH